MAAFGIDHRLLFLITDFFRQEQTVAQRNVNVMHCSPAPHERDQWWSDYRSAARLSDDLAADLDVLEWLAAGGPMNIRVQIRACVNK